MLLDTKKRPRPSVMPERGFFGVLNEGRFQKHKDLFQRRQFWSALSASAFAALLRASSRPS